MADVGPTVIPEDIDVDDAVLLTDAFPTGYQAAEMGDIKEGDTVVVFGAGPGGHLSPPSRPGCMGAGRVIVVDHVEYRLEFVRQLRAVRDGQFQGRRRHGVHIKKMTDWLGADVCIDAVGCEARRQHAQTLTGVKLKLQAGAATVLHWAINSVRKGGTVSIVGVYGPTFNAVPIGNAVNKGLTLRMNQASVKRHLPRLIEHIQAGRIKPSEIITHRIPLEEVADALPHVLEQARQLHQAGADPARRQLIARRRTMEQVLPISSEDTLPVPVQGGRGLTTQDRAEHRSVGPHRRLGLGPRPGDASRRAARQGAGDRQRASLSQRHPAAGSDSSHPQVDGARPPHAGVRHLVPAEGPEREDARRPRTSTAKASSRVGSC